LPRYFDGVPRGLILVITNQGTVKQMVNFLRGNHGISLVVGDIFGEASRRSAVAQDYVPYGDLTEGIRGLAETH
jgi:hypothetical protein